MSCIGRLQLCSIHYFSKWSPPLTWILPASRVGCGQDLRDRTDSGYSETGGESEGPCRGIEGLDSATLNGVDRNDLLTRWNRRIRGANAKDKIGYTTVFF